MLYNIFYIITSCTYTNHKFLIMQGLLNAVSELFPQIEHRMCTRHIYANWRKKHRDDDFQKPFWMCAKASSVPFFDFCKAKLAQLTPAGAKDMMNTNPKHWSRAWFNLGSNYDSTRQQYV